MSDDPLVDRLRDDYARLPVDGPVDVGSVARSARSGRRRRRLLVASAVTAVVALAGSAVALSALVGGDDQARDFTPATTSYDGPLDAPGRFGAAGRAIDCAYPPVGSRTTVEVYANGATSDSPRQAVETAYSEGLFLHAPGVDLGVAATEPDRQLLTYESGGRVLMALLLRDGPAAEGTGGAGWYLEAFARCDFAEFPEETARTGLTSYGAWTDTDGVPVPVAKVYSAPGPEHCDWQRMQWLVLDDSGPKSRIYLEEPEKDLLDYVAGPYRKDVPLPENARDTGWERDGRHLWLSTDGRYAYVGSTDSVDAWPRFRSSCA